MADSTPILTAPQWSFVAGARRATLATIRPDGRPRLVPVCFVLAGGPAADPHPRLYVPLDEKPKRLPDPRDLARVRDLLARPDVSVLVDRWDEDWGRLAWVRLDGRAHLLEPGGDVRGDRTEHPAVVEQLRAKYPQYREHALEGRPLIRISVERATSWGPAPDATTA